MFKNPFANSSSQAGYGSIDLSLLPPSTPVLRTLSYQYPLKLISPAPRSIDHQHTNGGASTDLTEAPTTLVHTVFLLTYGGGLVAGDSINLHVGLAPSTRLILLTQGSTKIFNSPSRNVVSKQKMTVEVGEGAGLCYLPDPVQPFGQSAFEQVQVYELLSGENEAESGSLCVCDWVCEGRTARGEKWGFWRYGSKNEVWITGRGTDKRRLLLRDNVILEDGQKVESGIANKMDGLGVFGTLILRGPLFDHLGKYFLDEFGKLPRIGSRKWGDDEVVLNDEEKHRAARLEREREDGLLWSAAAVRGCVVVKFGAKGVEGAKRWIAHMLRTEGSVEETFGERALLCLR